MLVSNKKKLIVMYLENNQEKINYTKVVFWKHNCIFKIVFSKQDLSHFYNFKKNIYLDKFKIKLYGLIKELYFFQ